MKTVILINPFTSVEYTYNFFKEKNIHIVAFFTSKNLKRSGYVATALNKIIFDKTLYSENQNLESDYHQIINYLSNKELLYCFVCSEIDDFKYSEKLANKLMPNLSNNPNTSSFRMSKYEMHEKLKQKGINYITQTKTNNSFDISNFNENKSLVLKPSSESCSASGVKFFKNINEFLYYKDLNQIDENYILQEKISGEEYIIDTFSNNGKHTIIGITKYIDNKETNLTQAVTTENVSQYIELLSKYIKDVLDTLDLKNGFCHSEVIIENNKPYLIEANPRLPGLKGFIIKSCDYFYSQNHLEIFYKNIIENKDTSNSKLHPTNKNNTIFLFNNLNYDFEKINTNVLFQLKSISEIDIINNKGKGATSDLYSRLNTIVIIHLVNENLIKLNNDFNKLLELQKNGILFI